MRYIEIEPTVDRAKIGNLLQLDDLYPWRARIRVPESLAGTRGVGQAKGYAFVEAFGNTPSEAVAAASQKCGNTILQSIRERRLKEAQEVAGKPPSTIDWEGLGKYIRSEFVKMTESLPDED